MGPALAGLFLLLVADNSSADPFPTRDQNPLLTGYGLPLPLPAQISDGWTFGAGLNWGSSAVIQDSEHSSLVVDAETQQWNMTLGHSLGDRWAAQLRVPYYSTSAGSLDSFIDGWHDFFGLPEGARPLLPRDQLRIAYERDGDLLIDVDSALHGVGDITVDLGRQLWSTKDSSLASWLSIKLPTGDPDKLTGSGATDVALTFAAQHRFDERWSAFGQLGVTWLGEGDLLPDQQHSVAWSGLAGVGVIVWRGLDLRMQFDAHSAVLGNDLDYLGEALILTVGGGWKFQSGWQLDFGVSEDILVDASPDVVFVIGVGKGPGGRGSGRGSEQVAIR
ncbi:MAG TPA: DUF3187 family protein [Povalibacter sp.]|nr:DUF3187 family protein [Povalibacter sp.]